MVHSSLAHLGIIDGIKIKQIPKIILKLLRKNLGKILQYAFPLLIGIIQITKKYLIKDQILTESLVIKSVCCKKMDHQGQTILCST